MTEQEFSKRAKEIVRDYDNEHKDPEDVSMLSVEDVFIVWECKILQNNKALLATSLLDGMYYEVTYNGDAKEFYLDAYKKSENRLIKHDGTILIRECGV